MILVNYVFKYIDIQNAYVVKIDFASLCGIVQLNRAVTLITAVTAVTGLNKPIIKVIIIGTVLILLCIYISQNRFNIKINKQKIRLGYKKIFKSDFLLIYKITLHGL